MVRKGKFLCQIFWSLKNYEGDLAIENPIKC